MCCERTPQSTLHILSAQSLKRCTIKKAFKEFASTHGPPCQFIHKLLCKKSSPCAVVKFTRQRPTIVSYFLAESLVLAICNELN
mmetsp:Transcript_58860/g.107839  ORF Transcript_58860/g.107839 Transcript_58860/m.107839 type:complete len:84 (-) Transcript_58860:137-388(-)